MCTQFANLTTECKNLAAAVADIKVKKAFYEKELRSSNAKTAALTDYLISARNAVSRLENQKASVGLHDARAAREEGARNAESELARMGGSTRPVRVFASAGRVKHEVARRESMAAQNEQLRQVNPDEDADVVADARRAGALPFHTTSPAESNVLPEAEHPSVERTIPRKPSAESPDSPAASAPSPGPSSRSLSAG